MDHHKCVFLGQFYDCFLLTLKYEPAHMKDDTIFVERFKLSNSFFWIIFHLYPERLLNFFNIEFDPLCHDHYPIVLIVGVVHQQGGVAAGRHKPDRHSIFPEQFAVIIALPQFISRKTRAYSFSSLCLS